MKIGVMSDTHGHLDLMRRAVTRMLEKDGAETIIHLGDDSTDIEELSSLPVELYWVPGVFESRYSDPEIANRKIKEFEEIPFLLSHTPTRDKRDLENDIDPTEAVTDGDVKVFLHGHLHKWKIAEEKEVIVINPGHLVPKEKAASKGTDPTYAILDVTSRKIGVKIMSLGGDIVAEKTFFFDV